MSRQYADRPTDPSERPPPTSRRVQPKRLPVRRPIPLYKVILLRSPERGLMFVVRTVMELTRFCRAEATHKMWEAHHCGRSVILVTWQERAELYADQFQSKGLAATIEPV